MFFCALTLIFSRILNYFSKSPSVSNLPPQKSFSSSFLHFIYLPTEPDPRVERLNVIDDGLGAPKQRKTQSCSSSSSFGGKSTTTGKKCQQQPGLCSSRAISTHVIKCFSFSFLVWFMCVFGRLTFFQHSEEILGACTVHLIISYVICFCQIFRRYWSFFALFLCFSSLIESLKNMKAYVFCHLFNGGHERIGIKGKYKNLCK